MADQNLQTLDGRAVSWAEITITINAPGTPATKTIDIKSIDSQAKVDFGEQRGASGGRVRKRTTGQSSNSASATFYKDGMRELLRQLLANAPKNDEGQYQISKVSFDILVVHSFEGDPDIYQKALRQCRLGSDSEKNAEGTDPVTNDVDLNPLQIVQIIDGKEVVLL